MNRKPEDDTNIRQFFDDTCVLITGGTGFLGNILLDKLIDQKKIPSLMGTTFNEPPEFREKITTSSNRNSSFRRSSSLGRNQKTFQITRRVKPNCNLFDDSVRTNEGSYNFILFIINCELFPYI